VPFRLFVSFTVQSFAGHPPTIQRCHLQVHSRPAKPCAKPRKGTDDHFPPGPSQRLAPQPTQGATWFPFQDIESGRPIDFVMVRIYFIFIILLFHKQLLTEIIIHRSEERASCSHGIEMRGILHEFIPGGVHENIDYQICCNGFLHTHPLHCTNAVVPNVVDIISTVE